jgi:pimeloyl-ACP methyl ester carboxylesterase
MVKRVLVTRPHPDTAPTTTSMRWVGLRPGNAGDNTMSSETIQRDVETNGVRMHLTEQGHGPLVLLCHGWPELGYSWRHQMPALAAAGYHVVVPDMRGFGHTDAPNEIEAYNILQLVGDLVGLVHALGERKAILVGHDWGAALTWASAMMRPDLFPAIAILSVPRRARGPARPLDILRRQGIHNFYWQYFQQPGVAEAEFERDVAFTLRSAFSGSIRSLFVDAKTGFLGDPSTPRTLPAWISEDELAVFVDSYRRTGFRGGLNWYRNMDRNWELTAPWQGTLIHQPTLFIAGARDPVIGGPMGEAAMKELPAIVPGLKRQLLMEGAGHWIQQERPAEVNAALLAFLREYGSQ